ncbi:MAG: RHS repeat protein [bacterium]|nr:RHS repeat protein [bacterium]
MAMKRGAVAQFLTFAAHRSLYGHRLAMLRLLTIALMAGAVGNVKAQPGQSPRSSPRLEITHPDGDQIPSILPVQPEAFSFGGGVSTTFPLYLGLGFMETTSGIPGVGASSDFALHLGPGYGDNIGIASGSSDAAPFALYLSPLHEGGALSAAFALNTWAMMPLTLLSPRDEMVVGTDNTAFSWSNVNAEYYKIWVDDDSDFSSPELQPIFLRPNNLNHLLTNAFDLGGSSLAGEKTYYWKVKAYAGTDSLVSPVWSFEYRPPVSATPNWAPLYRLYNAADTDHFYTTNDGQLNIAENSLFRRERVEGFVSTRRFAGAGMAEVFRFYDPVLRCHYYTLDGPGETGLGVVDGLISAGYLYEGIAGFAMGDAQPGLVPVYRVSKTDASDHLYTISEVEIAQIPVIWPGQFEPATVAFWVSPSGDTAGIPSNLWAGMVGDGVSPGTGNFQHYSKSSFSIPTVGLPLEFEHVYNSRSVHLAAQMMPLGPGWTHNYCAYVAKAQGLYLVSWPDGSIHRYDEATAKCLEDTFGVYDQLTVLAGGHFEIKKKNQVVYVFSRLDGTMSGYPSVLTAIRDRNQNVTTLAYEPSGLRRLSTVTDPAGRQLAFLYREDPDAEYLIREVRDVTGNRTVSFAYEDANGNLTSFTDCEGHVTQYIYDEGNPLLGQNHQLTRVRLPRGNVIDNTYNQRRVTAQTWGSGAGSLSIAYGAQQATTTTSAGSQIIETRYSLTPQGLIRAVDVTGLAGTIAMQRNDPANPGLPTWVQDRRGGVRDTLMIPAATYSRFSGRSGLHGTNMIP